MLIFEIAVGVALGLFGYQKYKDFQKETEFWASYRSPADTPSCGICGHPRAYHDREDYYPMTPGCSNCEWHEKHGKEHGWTESRPYSGSEGFMKAGDYSSDHRFQYEQKRPN